MYALIFALTTAIGNVIVKKTVDKTNEIIFIFSGLLFFIPFLFLIVILFFEIPRVDLDFFRLTLSSLFLDAIAFFATTKAVKMSEISLVKPIAAFNPVFTTLIAFVFLGESISNNGIVGIMLIVFVAYFLQMKKSEGLLKPFIFLFKNRGVQLSLLASLLWAVTPIFQREAIKHTFPVTPPFASMIGTVLLSIIYLPFALRESRKNPKETKNFLKTNYKSLIALGIIGAIGQTFAFTVFTLTKLGCATAVFKLSMVFTVVFGSIFFKEKNIKNKIVGSIIMLLGVILIAS